MTLKKACFFYLPFVLLAALCGYLYSEYKNRLNVDYLNCHSSFAFYNEDDNMLIVTSGTYSINLTGGRGLIQLAAKITTSNNETYRIFRNVELTYRQIDNTTIITSTKVIPLNLYDDIPPDLARRYLFGIYYEEGSELTYDFSNYDKKRVLFNVSLIPRAICHKIVR